MNNPKLNIRQKKNNRKCIVDNVLDKDYNVKERIGQSSVYGEVNVACKNDDCKDKKLALKKIPLEGDDFKFYDDKNMFENKNLNKSLLWSEVFFLKLTTLLVKNKVCPHLPVLYSYYVCDSCEYANVNINKKLKKCALLLNPIADGDLKNIIMKKKVSALQLLVIYFQIFLGLYCVGKYFNITHQDLHWGNVLYYKSSKTGKTVYTIDTETYNIPNIGYECILWDFGLAKIDGKVDASKIKERYGILTTKSEKLRMEMFKDYYRVTHMLFPEEDDEEITTFKSEIGELLLSLIEESDTPQYLIHTLGSIIQESYNTKFKVKGKDKITRKINTNKHIKIKDDILKEYYIHPEQQ